MVQHVYEILRHTMRDVREFLLRRNAMSCEDDKDSVVELTLYRRVGAEGVPALSLDRFWGNCGDRVAALQPSRRPGQ
jgi:hypothetical protein